jgi:hypothetical protein
MADKEMQRGDENERERELEPTGLEDRETNSLQPKKEELKDVEPGQEPTRETEELSKENREAKGKEDEGRTGGEGL